MTETKTAAPVRASKASRKANVKAPKPTKAPSAPKPTAQPKTLPPAVIPEDQTFPAHFYGPDGATDVFDRAEDVPAGWADHPSKVAGAVKFDL